MSEGTTQALESAEYLLSLDDITPRNANWWFAEARQQARHVLALASGLAAAEERAEKAERVIEVARPLATWAIRETLVETLAVFDVLAAASGEETE